MMGKKAQEVETKAMQPLRLILATWAATRTVLRRDWQPKAGAFPRVGMEEMFAGGSAA